MRPVDPWEELADLVLYNLEDWLREVMAMEPKVSSSLVTLTAARGVAGNIVESFVMRRDQALRGLRVIDGLVRRLPAHLRCVYRLRYVERLTRKEVAERVHCDIRTVDKRLGIIRGRVAARLRSMEAESCADFIQVLCRFCAGFGVAGRSGRA